MASSGALALHRPPGIGPATAVGDIGVALSALFVIGSVPVLPALLFWLWWRAHKAEHKDKQRAWTAFAAVLATYIFLAVVPVVARPRLVRSVFFRWWVEYFSVRIAYRGGEPLPRRQYLFLMMPHGLYPFCGACASISTMTELFCNMRIASASIGLRIPVVRHLMGWIGSIPADRASVAAALQQGESVCLFPGGISEMVRTNSESEQLVLQSRKGVVQLAVANGVPIVPVYVFGQSLLWGQLQLSSWVEALSRWLRLSIILPYGRWGTFVPRKLPLLYAIGTPIVSPRVEGTSQDLVDATHQKVVDSVRELYEFYRPVYGWEKRPLYID